MRRTGPIMLAVVLAALVWGCGRDKPARPETKGRPASKPPDDIASLIARLNDDHVSARIIAAAELGRRGDKRAVQPLIETLKREKGAARPFVVRAIARIADPASLDILVETMSDEDPSVRYYAIMGIVKIGGEKTADVLADAMSDPDTGVRMFAAQGLRKTHGERTVNAFLAALADADEVLYVRTRAAEYLGDVHARQAFALLVAALRERAVPGESWDRRMMFRAAAADALGKIGNPEGVEPLLEALKSGFPEVQCAAARALGLLGDPRALPALERLTGHPDLCIRSEAMHACITIRDHCKAPQE